MYLSYFNLSISVTPHLCPRIPDTVCHSQYKPPLLSFGGKPPGLLSCIKILIFHTCNLIKSSLNFHKGGLRPALFLTSSKGVTKRSHKRALLSTITIDLKLEKQGGVTGGVLGQTGAILDNMRPLLFSLPCFSKNSQRKQELP